MRHPLYRLSLLSTVLWIAASGPLESAEIERILDKQDDFELCSALYERLVDHYGGGELDVAKCKEKDRVVILVWHVSGIVDNGGFEYLWEGNLKGDPDFTKSAAAFKTVGALQCDAAFTEALLAFPGGKVPADIEQRLKDYKAGVFGKEGTINGRFFDGSKKIPGILARYIRANKNDFGHLQSADEGPKSTKP